MFGGRKILAGKRSVVITMYHALGIQTDATFELAQLVRNVILLISIMIRAIIQIT